MKIVRFQKQDKVNWGILENEKIFALEGDLYGDFGAGKELCPIQEVRLLAPAEPTIMVCCGMNYKERFNEYDFKERGWVPPEEPILFFKPATAVIGPMDDVIFPAIAQTLRYEAELCVIMKRRAKGVPENEAMDYVLGYTCGNELGAMDLMKKDKWMTRAKGFDTSGPLGPCLVTGLDPCRLSIESRVNGETKQDSNTRFMIFSVAKLISYISAFMTLRPGDIIWTGTPEGVCDVKVGDAMEVEIEGIGILKNKVVRPG
jgi:2-keto-4-pentenoate hydratase/2-oxohepta-3-ene-1,7-dioic acid hydratase in catechol pathway